MLVQCSRCGQVLVQCSRCGQVLVQCGRCGQVLVRSKKCGQVLVRSKRCGLVLVQWGRCGQTGGFGQVLKLCGRQVQVAYRWCRQYTVLTSLFRVIKLLWLSSQVWALAKLNTQLDSPAAAVVLGEAARHLQVRSCALRPSCAHCLPGTPSLQLLPVL